MSETPRTDSYLQNAEITCADDMAIHAAAFARQLERENAALREQLAEREAEVSDYKCRAQMNADAIQHYSERAEKATAECEHWKKNAASCHIERDVHAAMIERAEKAEAQLAASRAECGRLRGALELIAAPKRSDGTWNRDREACRALAQTELDTKEAER